MVLAGAPRTGPIRDPGLRLVVLADDLTGAADAAASLASRSPAAVMLQWDSDWPSEGVIALDAETRHADEGVAQHRLADLAGRAIGTESVLYKKVDSLARGNVGAELAAMLNVLRGHSPHTIAVLAPAFPSLGRTTAGAVVHADGRPVMRNGRPLNLSGLLQQSALATGKVPAPRMAERLVHQLRTAVTGKLDVVVVDGSTEDDLKLIVEAASRLEEQVLLVGSGGLARHVGDALFGTLARDSVPEMPPGARLFVVGSRTDEARDQRAALVAAGVLPLPVGDVPSGDAVRAMQASLRTGLDVVVFPDPAMSVAVQNAPRVAKLLSEVTASLIDAACTVVLTGGETAHAVLQAIGIGSLRIVGELEPGVVLSQTLTSELHVVTKAGSFGDDHVLVRRLHPTTRRSEP